ncbi:MAG: DNA polymerase III subunit delta [bacterium]
MKFDEITRALEGGKIKPLYLLVGTERFLIDSLASKIILGTLGPAQGTNLMVVSGEEVSVEAVAQTALTVPMFGGKKVIWIKNCRELKGIEKLKDYLKKPASGTILIFSDEKVDLRTRFWGALSRSRQAVVFKAYPLFDNQLPGWVRHQAGTMSCRIDSEAAKLLIELVGNDLSALASELEKLSLALKEDRRIDLATVEELVADTRKYNVFELLETLGSRNITKAIKIADSLMAEGEHPLKLLSMLVRQLRLIWRGKQLKKEGCSPQEIFKRLRILRRNEANFLKQLSLFSEKSLQKDFFLCRAVDLKLKSTAIPPQYLMIDLLTRIIP